MWSCQKQQQKKKKGIFISRRQHDAAPALGDLTLTRTCVAAGVIYPNEWRPRGKVANVAIRRGKLWPLARLLGNGNLRSFGRQGGFRKNGARSLPSGYGESWKFVSFISSREKESERPSLIKSLNSPWGGERGGSFYSF